MKKFLGVLGGSGEIGSVIVEKLLEFGIKNILVGARNINRIQKSDKIKKIFVDVNNKEELSNFCSCCHTVINCVGTISKSLDKVSRICLEKDANYVDVSGDLKLIDKLRDLNELYIKKNLCCIHSAGVNPGLTEVLTSYMSELYSPDSIEIFFSGNGKLSINAAIEMLNSFNDCRNITGVYIRNRELEKLNYFIKKQLLPDPIGNISYMPVINDNYYRCIKESSIKSAYFFNTFRSQNIIIGLAEIKMKQIGSNEILQSAKDLVKTFDDYNSLFNSEFTSHYMVLHCGEYVKEYQYIYQGGWNKLTGLVGAVVAMGVYLGKNCKKGLGEIWNSMNSKWVLEMISKDKDMKMLV